MSTITPLPKHMTPEAVREVQAAIKASNKSARLTETRAKADKVWPRVSNTYDLAEALRGLYLVHCGGKDAEIKKGRDFVIIKIAYSDSDLSDAQYSAIKADVMSFDQMRITAILQMFG